MKTFASFSSALLWAAGTVAFACGVTPAGVGLIVAAIFVAVIPWG